MLEVRLALVEKTDHDDMQNIETSVEKLNQNVEILQTQYKFLKTEYVKMHFFLNKHGVDTSELSQTVENPKDLGADGNNKQSEGKRRKNPFPQVEVVAQDDTSDGNKTAAAAAPFALRKSGYGDLRV